MKKSTSPRGHLPASSSQSPRQDLDYGLKAYSAAGKAAAIVGAAVGASAVASGQIINLTAASFGGTPTTVGGAVAGTTFVPGPNDFNTYHKQFRGVGFLPFGGNLHLRAAQYNSNGYNGSSQPAHLANGTAFMLVSGNGNPAWARVAGYGAAINFVNGAAINASNWTHTARVFHTYGTSPTSAPFNLGQKPGSVQFNLGVNGYVGFRVRKSVGHYYFGWVRVEVDGNGDNRPISLSLVPDGGGVYGAYNSTLDGPINAGQFVAIPEPSSVAAGLALFALGAAGVREYRRRRAKAA